MKHKGPLNSTYIPVAEAGIAVDPSRTGYCLLLVDPDHTRIEVVGCLGTLVQGTQL